MFFYFDNDYYQLSLYSLICDDLLGSVKYAKLAIDDYQTENNELAYHYDLVQKLAETDSTGKYDESIYILSKAVKLYPENNAYLCAIANIYHHSGFDKKSKQYYRKALRIDSKNHGVLYQYGAFLLDCYEYDNA